MARIATIAALLAWRPPPAGTETPPALSTRLVGGHVTHAVAAGETLTLIGSRFGVEPGTLARQNGRSPASTLQAGELLTIDNRHLVPAAGGALLVNIPQRMLFVEVEAGVRGYPVAVGRPDWRTPSGEFEVDEKRVNPTWYVPLSIQEEMRRAGKPVLKQVPPSPANPLGERWIGLSLGSVGIHGTNAPASIYTFQTHGCIRLHPDDAREVFDRIAVGTKGRIAYEPVLVGLIDGRVFLEVHRDVYGRSAGARGLIEEVVTRHGLAVNWTSIDDALKRREGVARDVTAGP
jgi:L,D-transpeptidase ErfK/SrfK